MPSSDSVPQLRLASVSRAPSARYGSLSPLATRSGDSPGVQGEIIGKYTLHTRIAAGGMASVYLGSFAGAADFSRVVAIKRMHPQIADNPTLAARFRDEAWLSARLLHPNIVQTFDVVEWNHELLLIMEYVDGITLRALSADTEASRRKLPLPIIAGILVPVLHGLHAAHHATDDDGSELQIVHRDFSPQNIIIGRDGHAKILDFGIAKVRSHLQTTSLGQLSGKVGYLSPEQILGGAVDRRTDVFAAGVVLWELLTGKRLFREPGLSEVATIQRVLDMPVPPPSHLNPAVPHQLDEIVLHALRRRSSDRFATVRELAFELEAALPLASPSTISNYLSEVAGPRLAQLSQLLVTTRRRFSAGARSAIQPCVHSERRPQQRVLAPAPDLTSTLAAESSPQVGTRKLGLLTLCVCIALAAAASVYASIEFTTRLPNRQVPTPKQPLASSYARTPRTGQSAPEAQSPAMLPTTSSSAVPAELPQPSSHPPTAERSVSAKPTRPAPRPSSSTPRAAMATPRSTCDPPTYLDSDGIRHFKPGCL